MILRIFAFVSLSLCSFAADGNWTQFRGSERSGATPGAPWPDELKGLQQTWQVKLDKGYPGPIVDATRVYVAETATAETEIVRALDRKTGKELWSASWPGRHAVPFFAKKNGDWIRATPAFDGKTLFVGGMEELLVALDAATGKEKWRVDFPKRFSVPKPDFGFSSSPMLDGDSLIVQAANSVIRIDKNSGEVQWRALAKQAGIMESGAFSSPVIATLNGRRQLLVQSRTNLYGLDPANGAILWQQDVPNYRGMNILMPTVWGNKIFTSSYRMDSYLFEITANGDKLESKEVWRNKAKGYMSTPILLNGYAYLHLGNQRFTCIDLRNGETKWTTEPFGTYWSMAVRDGKILALDERGQLLLIKANPEKFELLATREISNSPTWAHIAVAGNEIFVRELNAITAYRW